MLSNWEDERSMMYKLDRILGVKSCNGVVLCSYIRHKNPGGLMILDDMTSEATSGEHGK